MSLTHTLTHTITRLCTQTQREYATQSSTHTQPHDMHMHVGIRHTHVQEPPSAATHLTMQTQLYVDYEPAHCP